MGLKSIVFFPAKLSNYETFPDFTGSSVRNIDKVRIKIVNTHLSLIEIYCGIIIVKMQLDKINKMWFSVIDD